MPGGSVRAADGRRGDPSAVGRRVATWLYWALVVFVITAGVRSVVSQVFFAPPVAVQADEPCARVLDRLHAQLRENAITGRGAPAPASVTSATLREWDGTHRAIEPTCQGSDRARWQALGRMRYALEALLTRYDDEVQPLDERAGSSSSSSSNTRTNE